MPRVPVHTVDSAPESAKDNLRALTERVGKTLNIFGEMAHAPLVLDTTSSSKAVSHRSPASTNAPEPRCTSPSPT